MAIKKINTVKILTQCHKIPAWCRNKTCLNRQNYFQVSALQFLTAEFIDCSLFNVDCQAQLGEISVCLPSKWSKVSIFLVQFIMMNYAVSDTCKQEKWMNNFNIVVLIAKV